MAYWPYHKWLALEAAPFGVNHHALCPVLLVEPRPLVRNQLGGFGKNAKCVALNRVVGRGHLASGGHRPLTLCR